MTLVSESRPSSAEETQLYRPDMTPGGAELFLKCPVVFAPEYPDQIHGCGRMTGKPEDIPSRRESAPVHLILRQNIPGALGDT